MSDDSWKIERYDEACSKAAALERWLEVLDDAKGVLQECGHDLAETASGYLWDITADLCDALEIAEAEARKCKPEEVTRE